MKMVSLKNLEQAARPAKPRDMRPKCCNVRMDLVAAEGRAALQGHADWKCPVCNVRKRLEKLTKKAQETKAKEEPK